VHGSSIWQNGDVRELARESLIQEYVAALDEEELARRYREDDGFMVLPLLPPALVGEMAAEARQLLPRAVRKRVPTVRKAGAVGHPTIVAEAPALHAMHQSPSLLGLFSRLTGVALEHRNPKEPHASALYTYTEPGDWIDWHHDECGLAPGDSFSTIIGLVDDSQSLLEVETRRGQPEPFKTSLKTVPGTFAFLCGTRVHHRVTPLGENQQRITFAFTYVRQGRKPGGIYRFRLWFGNRWVYGLRGDPHRPK
jgi:hypothetical protein